MGPHHKGLLKMRILKVNLKKKSPVRARATGPAQGPTDSKYGSDTVFLSIKVKKKIHSTQLMILLSTVISILIETLLGRKFEKEKNVSMI